MSESIIDNNHPTSPLKLAFKLSLPVFFAYFPLGVVFSIIFVHMGFSWYLAPIMSTFVYGGSVQFLAISILAIHGSILEVLIASAFVALRNSFYGISLIDRFNAKWYKKLYLIFGLVDANYALYAITEPLPDKPQDQKFCLWLTFLLQFYWVAGTILGAVFSQWMPNLKGLSFVLPAFFMILVIESYLKTKSMMPLLIALSSGLFALFISQKYMMLIAICLSIALLFIYQGWKSS